MSQQLSHPAEPEDDLAPCNRRSRAREATCHHAHQATPERLELDEVVTHLNVGRRTLPPCSCLLSSCSYIVTMESIIELQRQEHEEIERYEQALADILNKPVTGVRCFQLALLSYQPTCLFLPIVEKSRASEPTQGLGRFEPYIGQTAATKISIR